MRKYIQFNTHIASAHYDDDRNIWTVTSSSGDRHTSTYVIATTGSLSSSLKPPFPGLDLFQGEYYMTSNWGTKPVDFLGKRVAVVGTGATGVQVIPMVAHSAASVTVFQRTPNYVMPGRNYPLTEPALNEIKRNYKDLWALARTHAMGFAMPTYGRSMKDYPPEEQQRILEAGWESGGFRYIFETFDDLIVDAEANEIASEFVRKKIRTVVHDKKTADLLCPRYPFMVKRPPVGHQYYEAFNRPNVHLVDISDNAIQEITPKGLRTATDVYEFDIIILALGFEVAVGGLTKIDFRSRGQSLKEAWDEKLTTFLGIGVQDFPNLFLCAGPQAPAVNAPMVVDVGIEFVGSVLEHMRKQGYTKVEPTKEAVESWGDILNEAFNATLIASSAAKVGSWFVGANVPGKKPAVLLYFGGLARYLQYCEQQVALDFSSFKFA